MHPFEILHIRPRGARWAVTGEESELYAVLDTREAAERVANHLGKSNPPSRVLLHVSEGRTEEIGRYAVTNA